MITKEVLQKFIDEHVDEIAQILSGGLKNKAGKWLLVCPIMERFDLDFSNVKLEQPATKEVKEESVVEEVVVEKPKKTRSKKKK